MLLQDLFYTTVIASLMGFTHPTTKLGRERPPDRLMSLAIWLPVACQFLTCGVFQVGVERAWPQRAAAGGAEEKLRRTAVPPCGRAS